MITHNYTYWNHDTAGLVGGSDYYEVTGLETDMHYFMWSSLYYAFRYTWACLAGTAYAARRHDTLYLGYASGWGEMTAVKGGTSGKLKFKNDADNQPGKFPLIPSSGIASGGDEQQLAMYILNESADDIITIEATSKDSDCVFATIEMQSSRELIGRTYDQSQSVLDSWTYDTTGLTIAQVETYIDTNSTTLSAYANWDAVDSGGSNAAGDISEKGELSCLGVATQLDDITAYTATVEITRAGAPHETTMTLKWDNGGGLSTNTFQLWTAPYDTLTELEAVIEGLGEDWIVTLEVTGSTSANDLMVLTEVSVLGTDIAARVYVETSFVDFTRLWPTDILYIDDADSPRNGCTYVVSTDIDYSGRELGCVGGFPPELVIFGQSATEIVVKVVRAPIEFEWYPEFHVPIFTSADPELHDSFAGALASVCSHEKLTGLKHETKAYEIPDLVTDNDDDRRECTFGVNGVKPGSIITIYNKSRSGQTGYFVNAFKGVGPESIAVTRCNGGPPGDRCTAWDEQDEDDATAWLDRNFYVDLMGGVGQYLEQAQMYFPYFRGNWTSPPSIPEVVGHYPDNTSLGNTRKLQLQWFHSMITNGSLPFKFFERSNSSLDPDETGFCEAILSESGRFSPHFGCEIDSIPSDYFGSVAYGNKYKRLLHNTPSASLDTSERL